MSAAAAADATAAHTIQPAHTAVGPDSTLPIPPHCLVILDAGAQYSKVIDRRIRELQVESHIRPLATPIEELQEYAGIIISGGPQSVYGEEAPVYDPRLLTMGKPILGICYGMQLLTHACGGRVAKGGVREDGQFTITVDPTSKLYTGMGTHIEVLLTHGDSVIELAPGFVGTSRSPDGILASCEDSKRKLYGVQYHPEVDLTPLGSTILKNFVEHVCELPRTFTLRSRQHIAIEQIRNTVGETSKVLCLLSGGVDSSVCAALLKEAIGAERIIAIHIDNGFMRHEESAKVVQALEHIGLKIHLIDARERFYHARTLINGVETAPLNTVTAPEVKRKIIGDCFMHVSNAELQSFGLNPDEVYLAQGTLRPDLIESASNIASVAGHAEVIKTHHNDTALVRSLRAKGRIIEPLCDLHKDEVRLLGLELGLPPHLVWRQPFPGPGLAVRIICANEPFRSGREEQIVRELKAFDTDKLKCALLACRTVGVQGDSRSYSSLVGISSTVPALSHSPNWHSLFHLSKSIPKTIHGVNRVVYVFGRPLKRDLYDSITPTLLQPEPIDQLQRADEIVNAILLKYGLIKTLSQVPVILFPIDFAEEEDAPATSQGRRSICIRTFITNDFMTGVPALPSIDHTHTIDEAVSSPSPAPAPSPNDTAPSIILAPGPPDSSPSPSPLTVEVPTYKVDHIPLSSVRFPTMPLAALQEMVQRILEEVPRIARVCFDLTSKPPATTEWE